MALLQHQDDFEAELSELASKMDLDGESEDDDECQGDGTQPNGSQVLLDAHVLGPDSRTLISLALNVPSPAERDSVLLLDSELNP